MFKNCFPNNLTFLRKEKKLSQSSLAEKIGVDQTTIGRWEDGNREPTMGNIAKLSEVFNIKADDLIGMDLSKNINKNFDKYAILFNKYKDLSDADKELIANIIETRKKQIDKELENNE